MRKKMLSILLALTAAMSLTFSACSEAPVMPEPQISKSTPQKPEIGENYYGNINYEYLSHGQIPYGKNYYGTLDKIGDEMKIYVSDLIDRCVRSEQVSGSLEEIVKEMYLEYIDADARNKNGADALLQLVAMIESCSTMEELLEVMGFLYQNASVSAFIKPDVMPDLKNTSVNILYLMNMNTLGNMKENFTRTDAGPEGVGKMTHDTLVALQTAPDEAKQRAKNVVKLLNEIMLSTMDAEDMRDLTKHVNYYDKQQLKSLFSNIDIEKVLHAFGFDNIEKCIVYDDGQAKKINELLTQEHIREIKDYLMTCIMYDYNKILPPAYSQSLSAASDFEKDPDEDTKTFLYNTLEHELGVLYGREICTDEVLGMVNKMVSRIQDSCRELIRQCDRLSDDGKNKYLQKMDNMLVKLGYDRNLTVPFTITLAKNGGTLIENVMAIKRGRTQKIIHSIGQAPDRNEWQMSAIEVNATYYPLSNTFEIPAVMMSKVFVDPADNEYYNLGRLGYVIGHEMSHAFDSNGFKNDAYGNLNTEWIKEDDQERYRQLMDKVTAYYDNVKLLNMYNIKGEQTLSENLADLSSVQCLLNVTDNKDDLRYIFNGIATQWSALLTISELMTKLNGDIHSPDEARVNAVVASMDAFYEIYDIKEGDKMYVAPENRIKVW